MFFLLIFPGCRESGLNLKIRYDQAHGLKKGAPVIFEKNAIGTVTGIEYTDKGDYWVAVMIHTDFAAATEHARFFIIDDPRDKSSKAVEMVRAHPGGTPLKNRATVEGSTRTSVFFDQMIGGFTQGFEDLTWQFDQFAKDLSRVPESEAFQKFESELKRLADEIERSGKTARDTIEKEWLPRLKQELEKLKERMRKSGREDELKPLERKLEKIKTSL
ncbi:MAG: hypothetical protein KKH68_03230 [Proteobacteria bacterium]|nr:hypothetical protein [Pseudomonadota bacterium]